MLQNIISFFQGRLDISDMLIVLLMYAVLIFVAFPFHELAHGFVADKLGDHTARWNGRLTMNPLAHLDPFGTVMMLLVGIGYAKPVPVNPRNFRNPRQGMALTALAGPASNLLMAVVSVGLFRICTFFVSNMVVLNYLFLGFVGILASLNISLAVFNLLPIPPLDGFRILSLILPAKWLYYADRYQQYITLGVFVLLFSGLLDTPLYLLRKVVGNGIGLLFGFHGLFG